MSPELTSTDRILLWFVTIVCVVGAVSALWVGIWFGIIKRDIRAQWKHWTGTGAMIVGVGWILFAIVGSFAIWTWLSGTGLW